jgi:hypothetical protein
MLHTARRAVIQSSPMLDQWSMLIVKLRRLQRVLSRRDALPFAFVSVILLMLNCDNDCH